MDEAENKKRSHRGNVSRFFEPRRIAIIGSFKEGFFGGYVIVKSLMNSGYGGRIYPVNPAYKEVHGLKVYPSIKEVPKTVDLVFILINARSVVKVVRECAQSGVRAFIVMSDGFAERDLKGKHLQKELLSYAREHGLRIIGPNTAGVVNTANGFNPCPYEAGYYKFRHGPVAVCAQTGMINPQAYPYPLLRFGVSKICDFGNKCDLDECDMLEYLEDDPDTQVISMYLETICDGKKFLGTAKRVASQKPVLILKSGRTREGAKASVSHTGGLAVDDKIFEATCNQAGILRIDTFAELFEIPKVFASQPLPEGNRLGIVTFTGGIAVLAIDEAAKYQLEIPSLGTKTADFLDAIFPGLGTMPVDIGPVMAAVKEAFDRYPKILDAVMSDKNVNALFNVLWANYTGDIIERYIEAYEGIKNRYRKPVVTWIYGPSAQSTSELAGRLEDRGFPVFTRPETAIKALGLAWRHASTRYGART